MSASPRPVGEPDGDTIAWWDATRERRLAVQRCGRCHHHQHYPRSLCVKCGGVDLALVDVAGRGTVWSHTTVHRAAHPALSPPYVVGLVRLDEGPMLLTNLPAGVGCDDRVHVVWEPLPDGRHLPLFEKD